MRKISKSSKITIFLIIMSMAMFLFAGCNSTSSKSNTTSQDAGQGNNKRFDPTVMKQQYVDALKGLVADGTIKQVQSDKVLVVLTKNIPKPGTQVKANNGQPSGQNGQQSGQNGQKNGQQGNVRNNVRKSPLSALVTSKVITQAQADIIMQKTRGNFKRTQN